MARSNSRPRSPAAALAVVLVATIGCAARSHAAGRSEDVAERLRLAAPEVVWRDEQQLDLNGDALMDHVVLGRTQTEAVVGFVLGTMSEPPSCSGSRSPAAPRWVSARTRARHASSSREGRRVTTQTLRQPPRDQRVRASKGSA